MIVLLFVLIGICNQSKYRRNMKIISTSKENYDKAVAKQKGDDLDTKV